MANFQKFTGKVAWIDVLNPTKKDIDFLRKQHKFHPIILDELLHLSARSRVEFYGTYLYLTYHFPIYDKQLKTSRRAEVDFLITKNKVITVHYEELEPLESFLRSMSNSKYFKTRALGQTSGHLVYYLIQEIIQYSLNQLRHIEENINFVTQEIFKGKEAKMLETISFVKRDILDFALIAKPQGILLNSLREAGLDFWGKELDVNLSDLVGDNLKIIQRLENYHEAIESFENTNAQILSAKTNGVMQKFTILAFLTFPLFFFLSMMQVQFVHDFATASPLRFWLLLFGSATVVVALLLVFKRRGWF